MKKFLFLLVATICFALSSCQDYEPFSYSDVVNGKYQQYKFDCVGPDLAIMTNFYGMGPSAETRTTDGGTYNEWQKMYDAYHNHTLSETAPINDAWWVLIENGQTFYCDKHDDNENTFVNTMVDMPGFNAGDPQGKMVFISKGEQKPNASGCTDNSKHFFEFVHLSDGVYHFVEIWATDSHGERVKCKVYTTFDYHPTKSYLLCIEDLAGNCLDFNDCVIVGGENMQAKVIYRMADFPMTIIQGNEYWNQKVELPGKTFGPVDVVLPWSFNTPDGWKDVRFIAHHPNKDVEIPVKLKTLESMPAVIATQSTYNFHKDENTMVSAEFSSIPFYHQ